MYPTRMSHIPNLHSVMLAVFTLAGILTAALIWSVSK